MGDLELFGAPADIIEQLEQKPELFEVEPECWPVVEMFLRLQTQWRIQDGCWLGLIYDSIVVLLDLESIPNRKEMFGDLQVMEFAALPILNEKLNESGRSS